MGIDFTCLELIKKSMSYLKKKNSALTIGRQGIHMGENPAPFCEQMFKNVLGFKNVDSIDNSSFEGASIIHNMNKQVDSTFNKYDFIYDGGTIEHIFNTPQVLENVIDLLEVGGIFCSVNGNNNFSGHGMYQYSPELFLSCFTKQYGMEIKNIWLAIPGTDGSNFPWIDVYNNKYLDGNRTTQKFGGHVADKEVYILVIDEKVSDDRERLINNPPNQFSYEEHDWKK